MFLYLSLQRYLVRYADARQYLEILVFPSLFTFPPPLSYFSYYTATMEEKPGERHLFRTSDVTSTMMLMPDCLSCLEADNKTDTCLFNRAHFSTDFSYYVLECLGPDVPRIYLFSTTWNNQVKRTKRAGTRWRKRVKLVCRKRWTVLKEESEERSKIRKRLDWGTGAGVG